MAIIFLFFILGSVVGTFITLFMIGIGKYNKEHEYYQEGFVDGCNKAQKEEEKSTIDIKEILKLSPNELTALMQEIQNQIKTKGEKKARELVAKHTELVGKCFKVRVKPYFEMFPEMWRYYKIISARANNEFRVSALRFDEYPTYWFNYQSSKAGCIGNYYFGHYDFNSIVVESCSFFNYNDALKDSEKFIEISPADYNTAMIAYIYRLQKMEWPADHYRYGNKKPEDTDWERKELNDFE